MPEENQNDDINNQAEELEEGQNDEGGENQEEENEEEEGKEEVDEVVDPNKYDPVVDGDLPEDKEEEDDIDEEDRARIEKVAAKKYDARIKQLEASQKVDAFIQENPDFVKYREGMIKHKVHPAYSHVPMSDIANIVAGRDLLQLGAAKERKAAANAKATATPGNTARKPVGDKIDWLTADKKTFEAKKAEVLGQV